MSFWRAFGKYTLAYPLHGFVFVILAVVFVGVALVVDVAEWIGAKL